MPAPAELIIHGTLTTPVLVSERLRRSVSGLDEGSLVFHCADPDTFIPGAECPGYPGLRIHEVDERTMPGFIETTLDVSGLKTGTSRQIALDWDEDPFGFDVANEKRIMLKSAASTSWATALTGYANMLYLSGGEADELDGKWITRDLVYRGIRRTGLVSRHGTVNDVIINPSEPIVVDLPGGWVTAKKSSVSLPRIQVIETVKSTTLPDMTVIPSEPGTVTAVSGFAFPSVSTVPGTISGPDLTYNYPYGWKIASIDPVQLHAGSSICVITYTYEYVWEAQF